GKNSPDWQDVQNTVLTSPGRALPIVVDSDGKKLEFTITPERKGREEAGDVGMFPVIRTIVQDVQANSPAARAGGKPGDEISRVNGIDLRTSGRTLQQTIQQMSEKTFPITVVRGQNPVALRGQALPQGGQKEPGQSSGVLTTLWNGILRFLGRDKSAADVAAP